PHPQVAHAARQVLHGLVGVEAGWVRIAAGAAHAMATDAQAFAGAAVAAGARDRIHARGDAVRTARAACAHPACRVRTRVLGRRREQTALLMAVAAEGLIAMAGR